TFSERFLLIQASPRVPRLPPFPAAGPDRVTDAVARGHDAEHPAEQQERADQIAAHNVTRLLLTDRRGPHTLWHVLARIRSLGPALPVLAAISFVSQLGIAIMLPLLPLYGLSLGASPLQLGLM